MSMRICFFKIGGKGLTREKSGNLLLLEVNLIVEFTVKAKIHVV